MNCICKQISSKRKCSDVESETTSQNSSIDYGVDDINSSLIDIAGQFEDVHLSKKMAYEDCSVFSSSSLQDSNNIDMSNPIEGVRTFECMEDDDCSFNFSSSLRDNDESGKFWKL